MTEAFDIAVIGGGIVGAAAASFIGGKRSVVLLEREEAFGYHATGRSAAEFSLRFHSEGAGKLTRASAAFMHHPPDGFADIPLLRPRGNLLIADATKAEHLREIYEAEARTNGPDDTPLEVLTVGQALEKVPFLDLDWVKAALYDPACWDIEVETLLQSYLKSARRAGASTRTRAAITGARRDSGHWLLETKLGEIAAKTVINAAGGWADQIAALFEVPPLSIVPHRRTAIAVKAPGYDLAAIPEVNEIDEVFYFKPDAGQLMVSPADETPVDPHDAWPDELDIAYAAHYLGECTTLDIRHIAHSWAGLRTFAPDRLPVIGFSSLQPDFFWLAGLGGYGIQTSPAVGQIAASLVTGGEIAPPLPQGLALQALAPARLGG